MKLYLFNVEIWFLLAARVASVVAFRSSSSSVSVDVLNNKQNLGICTRSKITTRIRANSKPYNDNGGSDSNTNETTANVASSFPWRVVLDIGREPLARMPFDWARKGVRMPLVVPSDFCFIRDATTKNKKNLVVPRGDGIVSFTGPEGVVESPIEGGEWKLSEDSTLITFSYIISQELRRRDVYLEAGTELILSTSVYTQTNLDRLNQDYYDAREELWEFGGDLNAMSDRQGASKKWNPETERWERRYPNENPFNFVTKQFSYWGAMAKQTKTRNRRPEVQTLSDVGGKLPSVDGEDNVYLVKDGVVRYGENGPVCGLFTAQPITNVPAWDRGK